MKIRRFFAPDMRQAIRMVREEQGPDAVILSSRKVEGGIEIVSAMDYDRESVNRMTLDDSPEESVPTTHGAIQGAGDENRQPSEPSRPVTEARRNREVVWHQDPALVAMQREIESLRGMLQEQLAGLAWNDLRLREPERVRMIGRLEQLGLERELAIDVASRVQHPDNHERAWREALDELAGRIRVAPETRLDGKGCVALVGPSGVGKTTTVAKLAARHVQRHGRHSLALVTTDTYRIGAYRQLQTYGQLLGVSTHLAQSGRELAEVLDNLNDRQRVFLDTAGMSQRDLRLAEELAGLGAVPGLRTLLVVAANTQRAVLEEAFQAFAHLPLTGAVLTKVDEAASLGPALSVLSRGDPPIMYLSQGQRVPEDLEPASPERLIARAVPGTDREAHRAPGPGIRPAYADRNPHVSIQ